MKKLITLLFVLISYAGFGQVYQLMPQYGYQAPRMSFDSTLQIPTVCGVPTLKSVQFVNRKGAIAFDSCNNRFYTYNPKTLTWSQVSGGGGSTDTTSLSARIDARVKYTDTASMLTPYFRRSLSANDTIRTNGRVLEINATRLTKSTSLKVDTVGITMDMTSGSNSSDFALWSSYMAISQQFGVSTNQIIMQPNVGVDIASYNASTNDGLNTTAGVGSFWYVNEYDTIGIFPRTNGAAGQVLKLQDGAQMVWANDNTIDTSNRFVNSVTKLNDSTIQVIKGNATTNITLTTSSIVTAATRLVTTVYNSTGSTIPKGSVVYISGRHNSNLATVAPAQANNEENSYKTFALVENDITNNNSGTVIQAGSITGLNLPTSSYTDGDIVYLSPTVAGGITTTKPLAPFHICKIGSITRAHPNAGSIEIKIENGWQLDELSDVSIPLVPADSVLLQFSRVDSLWHDVTITNAIGTRYIRPADTSVFQRKQLPAYSFQANGTSAAANSVATYFKDTSGTYTGTIAWTGTTAPSGATNHSYRWTRVGKMVTLNIILVFATNGAAITALQIDLPSDCPAPAEPAGLTGASQNMYPALIYTSSSTNALLSSTPRGFLRNNTGNTGHDFLFNFTSHAPNTAHITLTYWTN
jgi:hypothetical protein